MCNQKNKVILSYKRTFLSDIYFIKGKMSLALEPLTVFVDKCSTSVLYKVCVDYRQSEINYIKLCSYKRSLLKMCLD